MPQTSRRKKIKVKVSKTSVEKPLEVDLKSAIHEEESAQTAKKEKEAKKPFFSPFSSAEKPKKKITAKPKEEKEAKKPLKLRINLYKKIAFSFLFLTLLLVAAIVYLSFVKVVVTVVPNEQKLNGNLILDVFDQNKNQNIAKGAVSGVIESVEVEQVKNYPSSGQEVVGEETTGKVAIINNNNQVQTLVATTRLLSSDGKLFRTKDTVYVPARGSVEVDVYADAPGENMAIGPTRFTIPGLWAGLQDKIYAENKESFKHEEKIKKNIQQSDIEAGIEDLKKELLKKADEQAGEKYKNYRQVMYDIDKNTVAVEVDGKAGEEKEEFSVTMKAAVTIIAFNDDLIKNMAREKLAALASGRGALASFNENTMVYSLSSSNFNQGTATINISFEGSVSPKSSEEIVDKKSISGLTREQLNDFLGGNPEIKDYEVKYCPSFLEKVPKLQSRIKIQIKK